MDSGIYEGWDVPVYYDPLLAKLSVWAETREQAVRRLERALGEYVLEGVRTSLPFFRAVVQNEEFRHGQFDTGFIDRFISGGFKPAGGDDESVPRDLARIAAVLSATAQAGKSEVDGMPETESKWKLNGRISGRR